MEGMHILKEIKENNLVELFMNGNFGLEKEGLRAVLPANLARTNHPKSLGHPESHPYIQTDYGEAMPEIITPPLAPYVRAHNYLQALQYVLNKNLAADEYIWPFSVPCNMPADDAEIKIALTKNAAVNRYREYTAAKYGKKRQHISGIHINYSFNNELLEKLFEQQEDYSTIGEFRDELYLKFASNMLRYQWLHVYLFGASPIAEDNFYDSSFFVDEVLPTEPMRSLRNSQYGFINRPEVAARYDSIENYVGDLTAAVKSGQLKEVREFYGDIRLRGIVKDPNDSLKTGIQYVEIRSFDNNPYCAYGLDRLTLQFVHLFILTMISMPKKASPEETEKGKALKKIVAAEHPLSKTIQYDEGIWLLEEMQKVIEVLGLEQSYTDLVEQAVDQLNHPEKTIAGKIVTDIDAGYPLLKLGEKIGWEHKTNTNNIQELPGFEHFSDEQQQEIYEVIRTGKELPSWIFEEKE